MWAVRFEGVTKRYRLERTKYRSIRTDIADVARRAVGVATTSERPEVVALRDLDVEIEAGTSYAIVGRNGAGKSTALRLISRITYPSAGRVRVRGRVGALIEVGAGVHPELSGRENIGLYGSFLGFSRADVRKRFYRIVEFAEIEDAVDTPVKYYSTGMKLRLGFAIAAFLEPAVFIVDESLAVGDGAFQAKCINRMMELSAQGSTIIFVSHELAAVEALCDSAIWLDRGRLVDHGPIGDILRAYSRSLDEGLSLEQAGDAGVVRCVGASTHDSTGRPASTFDPGDQVTLRLRFEGPAGLRSPSVSLRVTDGQRDDLIECSSAPSAWTGGTTPSSWRADCTIDALPLNPRMYQVWCSVVAGSPPRRMMDWSEIAAFRIQTRSDPRSNGRITSIGGPPVAVTSEWRITQ